MEISLSELSEVKGIGKKTIQRIREYKLADEGYISEYDENLHLDRNSVNQGDCLELMNGIKNKSVDMILADLPYGTTACSWDSIINLDKLWLQYERIIKDNGAILLTASQPFTTTLIGSNKQLFRYEWIWDKKKPTGWLTAKKMPMKQHENILVFYKELPKYNPQPYNKNTQGYMSNKKSETFIESLGHSKGRTSKNKNKKGYARSIINEIPVLNNLGKDKSGLHPTQKPVALFEYLIKTYTNEGNLVLDNVAGSGTTGAACKNTNRDYIIIEQEEKYIDIIKNRLKAGE